MQPGSIHLAGGTKRRGKKKEGIGKGEHAAKGPLCPTVEGRSGRTSRKGEKEKRVDRAQTDSFYDPDKNAREAKHFSL